MQEQGCACEDALHAFASVASKECVAWKVIVY